MAILANSEGWMEKPATRIQSREPLTLVPATTVSASNARPSAPIR